jgi:hypothetical protein
MVDLVRRHVVQWLFIAVAVLGVTFGAFIAWNFKPDPKPPPSPTIPAEQVVEEAPDPEPTVITRVIYRDVPVVSVGVADSAATDEVEDFVDAATDTTGQADPEFLPYQFRYDHGKLSLWGIRSDGAKVQEDRLKVSDDWFEGGWTADSTWVRQKRDFPKLKVVGGAVVVVAIVACVLAC